MGEFLRRILATPLNVGVIWPVIFALWQVVFRRLIDGSIVADGEKKFWVRWVDQPKGKPQELRYDLEAIRDGFKPPVVILEIFTLPRHVLERVNFGPDMFIVALGLYLTAAFVNITASQPEAAIDSLGMMVLVIGALLSFGMLLRESHNAWYVAWLANVLSLILCIVPFFLMGVSPI